MDTEVGNNVTQDTIASSTPGKMHHVKLVLLGDSAVGKSSIAARFVNRKYEDNKEPTIGAAFLTQKCNLKDRSIKLEIWDTAGQERFHSLAPMYYRNAQAAAVVYDITKAATLDKAKSWVKELQRQASTDIVVALVGNKLDLVEDINGEPINDTEYERQVFKEDAKAYAEEAGLMFFETSAKLALNVDNVFSSIASKIPLETEQPSNIRNAGRGLNNGIDLKQASDQGSSNGCAC
ncbi:hypothetical protein G6F56_007680 [Rhizopus delemar]|nr:hypothetical protein G6F56_007680 [Rhizopus delemar]